MTSGEREKRVRNYFAKPPKQPVKDYVKAAIGLILIIIGAHIAFLLVIGLLVLLWGGFGVARYLSRVAQTRPKATDAEMDAWLDEALVPTAEMGAKRLNVHPTELTGPMEDSRLIFVGFPNISNVRNARGDDKKLRYSHYEILVVYLSNWRLPVYQVNYDMENGVTVLENTKEYNLAQVDGIETSSDRVSVLSTQSGGAQNGSQPAAGAIGHVTNAQILSLMVSGNHAVTLITGVTGAESVRIENVDEASRIDTGISRLREHLRVRHQGAYQATAGGPGNAGFGGLGAPAGLGLDLPPQAAAFQPNALGQGPGFGAPESDPSR